MSETRASMLRRYTLVPELAAEFLTEVFPQVVASRSSSGFVIEHAWVDERQTEFTWLLSYPGGPDALRAAEDAWMSSEARHRIFDGRPRYVVHAAISIVTPFDLRGAAACGLG